MKFSQLALFVRQASFRNKLMCACVGVLGGILLWNLFILSLEASATTEFCTSCHSMQSYIYPAYQLNIHYRNSKGIQAGCSDCHIPKPLGAKLVRKTIGLKDVYHTILSTIDSPEKYNAKKALLAERVRNRMRASDSRECRNCHQPDHMDYAAQSIAASKQHREAKKLNKTCIDCHQGVGHSSPSAADNEQQDDFSLE